MYLTLQILGFVALVAGFFGAFLLWIRKKDKRLIPVSAISGITVFFLAVNTYYIPAQTSGHVTVKVGEPLNTGQIIALPGQRGLQSELLLPGWGWNAKRFLFWTIDTYADIRIPAGSYAVLTATDGANNPKIVAPKWADNVDPKRMIEDYQYFLDNGGTRGAQQYLVTASTYRINRFQWKVEIKPMHNVQSDRVLVVESLFGKAPAFTKTSDDEILSVPLVESEEYRGIVDKAYASGNYSINPYTQRAHYVPIILQTFIYGGGYTAKYLDLNIDAENDKLITTPGDEKRDPEQHGAAFAAKTKDNHTVYIDVRVLGQIEPIQAPRFVGTIKDVNLLDNRIIEPYTKNILTNLVLKYDALELKDQKEKLGNELSAALRERTEKTGFRTKTVEITNIDIPPIVLIPGKIESASVALKEAMLKKQEAVTEVIKVRNLQDQADNQTKIAEAISEEKASIEQDKRIRRLASANRFKVEEAARADAFRVTSKAKATGTLVKILGPQLAGNIMLQETINEKAGEFNTPDTMFVMGQGADTGIVGAQMISNSLKSGMK
jgi:hypothetical protein